MFSIRLLQILLYYIHTLHIRAQWLKWCRRVSTPRGKSYISPSIRFSNSVKMMMDKLHSLAKEPPVYKVLTNNEDRIMCALRCMIDNKIMDQVLLFEVEQKTAAKAIAFINVGNALFSRSNFAEAVRAYCWAIMFAVPGSKELARAYANRSAASCEMDFYNDTLKDIDRALAIGYPDNLRAKLYIRQAKCLWALNKKMCPEIKKSIANAEEWIKKANKCDRNKLQSALNNINVSDINRMDPTSTREKFMPKTPTDNPKILRASGSIGLKYSEEFGRHLVATQDINAGQVLFVDKAYTAIEAFISIDGRFTSVFCWNCLKICFSGVPCTQCINVNYCDEKCRNEDWDNYHEIDCPVIIQLLAAGAELGLFQALRMTIKAFKEAKSFRELKNKICKIDSMTDPVEKFLDGHVFDSSKYASVYSLITDSTFCPFHQAVSAAATLMLLSRITKIFGIEMQKITDIIDHKWTIFIGSLILRNLQIANAFSSERKQLDELEECLSSSHVVQPLVALCNHSCDANVCLYYHHDVYAVYTLQKISKGQQIFLSYDDIDFQKYSKNVRRKLLEEKYKFRCTCAACTNDWKISKMKSLEKYTLLSSKISREMTITMGELSKLRQITGYTTLPQQLDGLASILNMFDSENQDSCQEFFQLKSMLRDLCKDLSY